MRIRCINNTGDFLKNYEYNSTLPKEMLGRFGSTGFTEYNEIVVGNEYLVMGVIVFKTYQAYLIDDSNHISAFPCQLFEIIDDKLDSNWHFRMIDKDEGIYPFVQAIFGYSELCYDKLAYENLIIEKDEEAIEIYFRRKAGLERASAE